MIPETYLHASFLVPNLELAIEEFGSTFGTRFHAPLSFPIADLDQIGIDDDEGLVRYSYSIQGPPYYELIEAVGSHIYKPEQGFGFHHLGMWMDDEQAMRAHLTDMGIGISAISWSADHQALSIFTEPFGPLGLRIEFMNRRFQPMFERFFSTGRLEG